MTKVSDGLKLQENLERNTANYKETKGHEPYFALTPEGAARLKKFLGSINMHEQGCVRSEDLRSFFIAAGMDGFHAEKLSAWDMYALLGAATSGYQQENLFIDSVALDGISRSKLRQR